MCRVSSVECRVFEVGCQVADDRWLFHFAFQKFQHSDIRTSVIRSSNSYFHLLFKFCYLNVHPASQRTRQHALLSENGRRSFFIDAHGPRFPVERFAIDRQPPKYEDQAAHHRGKLEPDGCPPAPLQSAGLSARAPCPSADKRPHEGLMTAVSPRIPLATFRITSPNRLLH